MDSIETIRAILPTAADGDDPFILNAEITLSFAVTAEGEISIGIDGSLSDELTHSLVLALVSA